MKTIAPLCEALRQHPEGKPWVRGLAQRIATYGVPVTIRGGKRSALHVRHAAPGEGAPGILVAELEIDGARRVIATSEGPRLEQRSSGNREKVRSVRIGEELWQRTLKAGKPSDVIRDALDEYLTRRSL